MRTSYASTCTACARFSDGNSGSLGIMTAAWQRLISSFSSPVRSLPNTSATSPPSRAAASTRAAASRGSISSIGTSRRRAVAPSTSRQSAIAVGRSGAIGAFSSTSSAPAASAVASACGNACGATSDKAPKAHRADRARRGADIARMRGAHEHEADAIGDGMIGESVMADRRRRFARRVWSMPGDLLPCAPRAARLARRSFQARRAEPACPDPPSTWRCAPRAPPARSSCAT